MDSLTYSKVNFFKRIQSEKHFQMEFYNRLPWYSFMFRFYIYYCEYIRVQLHPTSFSLFNVEVRRIEKDS